MLPMMIGFFVMGPISGSLSDRYGARGFATVGMLLSTLAFVLLTLLPADFSYVPFVVILLIAGVGMGMFAAPNTTAIMNTVVTRHCSSSVADSQPATDSWQGILSGINCSRCYGQTENCFLHFCNIIDHCCSSVLYARKKNRTAALV
ncbi:MFS transporter [Desulfosporosinus sp. SB140]|uniref:MFS transporter n=1 Tax=Desulfosporosinus paludis TaxID=3115649 RepID=UPI00388E0EAC